MHQGGSFKFGSQIFPEFVQAHSILACHQNFVAHDRKLANLKPNYAAFVQYAD